MPDIGIIYHNHNYCIIKYTLKPFLHKQICILLMHTRKSVSVQCLYLKCLQTNLSLASTTTIPCFSLSFLSLKRSPQVCFM